MRTIPAVKQSDKTIEVRRYGAHGAFVLVLHGGPAAPGYMKPVGEALAGHFRVIEPFQRGSDTEPLTVSRHIQDLQDVIEYYCGGERPLLVGHSWGAMLALAWAAEHPDAPRAIVLVGSGSFDDETRARMQTIREGRMDATFRRHLEQLPKKHPKPNVRLAVLGGMYQRLDSVDLIQVRNHLHPCDAAAHEQTWNDMIRAQREGLYPQAFGAIECPVVMLHGDDDPHPAAMIRESLTPYLPQLEYHSWPQCGHYPWLEKAVHHDFYETLIRWLRQHAGEKR
ncbi:MAG: alpha/beta fold hydrolase [Planctomycetota bacterium]